MKTDKTLVLAEIEQVRMHGIIFNWYYIDKVKSNMLLYTGVR